MSRFDILFARPNIWSGMARLMDWGGTLKEYNASLSVSLADSRAMKQDWKSVGDDFCTVMETWQTDKKAA